MSRVIVIDYGMGNIDSVCRAISEFGPPPLLTRSPHDIKTATHIILPGVGSFHDAMMRLNSYELSSVIREQVVDEGIPFLGICLGMQLMATLGHEGGETTGLDLITGEVSYLGTDKSPLRIPHMGWNEVLHEQNQSLLSEIPTGTNFYFAHSYFFNCSDPKNNIAVTPYGRSFASVIGRGNAFGVQFHPEKSQKYGLRLISNFLSL